MAASKEQLQYIRDYKKEHIERIRLEIPKGKKDLVRKTAAKHNLSMNRLIIESVETQYGIDLRKE